MTEEGGNTIAQGGVTITPVGQQFTEVVVACFAEGTRIRTPRGDVRVEALRVGDHVATACGESRKVVWLGHRRVDCRLHPRPRAVWPVRVAAHACGPGLPHADLLLSPDHAVYLGGVLVPIRHLVNGVSIAQLARDAVTYWHVELDRHDVLLAEGLPCESFLDTGQRGAFDGGGAGAQLHPDLVRRRWDGEACAPMVVAGPDLARARAMLATRHPAGATRCAAA